MTANTVFSLLPHQTTMMGRMAMPEMDWKKFMMG